MKIELNKFCVYIHRINNDVIYVGKGRSYRPFEQNRRNDKWVAAVTKSGHFDVEIVAWFYSDIEARLEESRLIRTLRPSCNKHQTEGYESSEWQRKRASESNKGKVLSEETRNKISNGMKGREPSNKGKHISEDQKVKLRLANKKLAKPVICIDTKERYESTKHAARLLDIPASTLRAHLSGKLEHAKCMRFEYC